MTEQFSTRRRFPRIASNHAVLVKKLGSELEEFGLTTDRDGKTLSFPDLPDRQVRRRGTLLEPADWDASD